MRYICSHHIGGRAGNRSFPVLKEFERDFINVIYDADQDCVAQIKDRNSDLNSRLKVMPYCVGGENKDGIAFNINYDPYTSSLLEMNPEYADWYFYFRRDGYDYIVADTYQTQEKRKQNLVTLDAILASDKSIEHPNILSLDAQGVEDKIVTGAANVLRTDVLAVISEVAFHPLYKGQVLFGDLCSMLSERGFEFVKFAKDFGEYCPYRKPIGLRGEGFQVTCDVVFFRNLDDLESVRDLVLRQELFDKMAFIAIVFDQFEYAIECIERSRICRKSLGDNFCDENQFNYIRLIREIEIEAERIDKQYPPKFSEKFSFAKSKARFDVDYKPNQIELDSNDHGYDQCDLLEHEDSGIEKTLRKYGLLDQADLIKKRRIKQS